MARFKAGDLESRHDALFAKASFHCVCESGDIYSLSISKSGYFEIKGPFLQGSLLFSNLLRTLLKLHPSVSPGAS